MLTDEQSRRLIVEDLNSNYFVEASAGSGKTYSLVLRMVAMIEGNKDTLPVPVDQICTITFTKAAAAEFFSRFQKILSLRSVPKEYDVDALLGPKTEQSMARCRDALANIDLCFLGTIDAFCNMIAHELPTELGIPSDAEVISKDDRLRLLEETYERILKDETHPSHRKALMVNDLFYKARDTFAKAMSYIGDLRNGEIPYDQSLIDININSYFPKQERDEFLKYVAGLCSSDIDYNPKNDGSRNDKYRLQTTLKTLYPKINKDDWSNSLSDLGFALKQIKDMEGFSIKVFDTTADVRYHLFDHPERTTVRSSINYCSDAKKCFERITNKLANYKFAVLLDFMSVILHETFDSFKEEGKLGYFDYQYYLNEALRKDYQGDRRIINHILKRHSRFLLDESQDTNPIQTELFFYLTGTNKSATKWINNKPFPGSLFIVGDPKQSIYAFRNANVQAFNTVKDVFAKDNKVLVLTKNFRSKEIVKEWFNGSMNNVLNHGVEPLEHLDIPIDVKKKQEQLGEYEIADNVKVELYQGVYKYTIGAIKEDAIAVAKLIMGLVNDSTKYIQVKNKKTDKNEVRRITFGDIRVVPRKADVKEYVKAFNDYHIPVTVEADIPFDKSETLTLTTDLAVLLKTPNDKAQLFKILYGSLFGLDDLDIIQMKKDQFKFDLSLEPVKFSKKEHQQIINLLHSLWKETQGFSFSSTLLYILNHQELNIYQKINTDFLEYTLYLIEKIKEKEEAGLMSGVEEFKQYVNDFIGGDTDDNRTVRFNDGANRVILANLHKVKGLQAPIVILCGPNKAGRRSIQHVDYTGGYPIAKLAGINYDFMPLIERHDLSIEEQREWDAYEKAEAERVEYVGATRAESVLIVADKAASKNQSTSDYPQFNPWRDLIANIPNDQSISVPDIAPSDVTPQQVDMVNPLDYAESKALSVSYVSPSKKAHDTKVEMDDNNLDEIKEKTDSGLSTKVGTLIHRLMECLVSSKGAYADLSLLVNQIINEYHTPELKDVLMDVATKITSGGYPQKNSRVKQDILKTLMTASEVYCETPFSFRKGNEIINGVIDLIYKDQDGYHIIDYKTNKEDDVSFLENNEYKEQLSDYITALKEMGENADAHIYHISYPRA